MWSLNHPSVRFINKCTTIYVLYVLILQRMENRSTRRKTLGAQERSTAGTLSLERRTPDLAWLSVVRGTRAPLMNEECKYCLGYSYFP